MTRASTRTMFDRIADRMLALEDGAYGDERERGILLEANAFGLSIGIYAALTTALVLALLGHLVAPLLLVLVAILPATAANAYARRRNVDAAELAERSGVRSTPVVTAVLGAVVMLTFAAMTMTVFAEPVLPTPATPAGGPLGGMVQGGVIGGMLGGLATIVGGLVSLARARRAAC